jgi:hypothetical protein
MTRKLSDSPRGSHFYDRHKPSGFARWAARDSAGTPSRGGAGVAKLGPGKKSSRRVAGLIYSPRPGPEIDFMAESGVRHVAVIEFVRKGYKYRMNE